MKTPKEYNRSKFIFKQRDVKWAWLGHELRIEKEELGYFGVKRV